MADVTSVDDTATPAFTASIQRIVRDSRFLVKGCNLKHGETPEQWYLRKVELHALLMAPRLFAPLLGCQVDAYKVLTDKGPISLVLVSDGKGATRVFSTVAVEPSLSATASLKQAVQPAHAYVGSLIALESVRPQFGPHPSPPSSPPPEPHDYGFGVVSWPTLESNEPMIREVAGMAGRRGTRTDKDWKVDEPFVPLAHASRWPPPVPASNSYCLSSTCSLSYTGGMSWAGTYEQIALRTKMLCPLFVPAAHPTTEEVSPTEPGLSRQATDSINNAVLMWWKQGLAFHRFAGGVVSTEQSPSESSGGDTEVRTTNWPSPRSCGAPGSPSEADTEVGTQPTVNEVVPWRLQGAMPAEQGDTYSPTAVNLDPTLSVEQTVRVRAACDVLPLPMAPLPVASAPASDLTVHMARPSLASFTFDEETVHVARPPSASFTFDEALFKPLSTAAMPPSPPTSPPASPPPSPKAVRRGALPSMRKAVGGLFQGVVKAMSPAKRSAPLILSLPRTPVVLGLTDEDARVEQARLNAPLLAVMVIQQRVRLRMASGPASTFDGAYMVASAYGSVSHRSTNWPRVRSVSLNDGTGVCRKVIPAGCHPLADNGLRLDWGLPGYGGLSLMSQYLQACGDATDGHVMTDNHDGGIVRVEPLYPRLRHSNSFDLCSLGVAHLQDRSTPSVNRMVVDPGLQLVPPPRTRSVVQTVWSLRCRGAGTDAEGDNKGDDEGGSGGNGPPPSEVKVILPPSGVMTSRQRLAAEEEDASQALDTYVHATQQGLATLMHTTRSAPTSERKIEVRKQLERQLDTLNQLPDGVSQELTDGELDRRQRAIEEVEQKHYLEYERRMKDLESGLPNLTIVQKQALREIMHGPPGAFRSAESVAEDPHGRFQPKRSSFGKLPVTYSPAPLASSSKDAPSKLTRVGDVLPPPNALQYTPAAGLRTLSRVSDNPLSSSINAKQLAKREMDEENARGDGRTELRGPGRGRIEFTGERDGTIDEHGKEEGEDDPEDDDEAGFHERIARERDDAKKGKIHYFVILCEAVRHYDSTHMVTVAVEPRFHALLRDRMEPRDGTDYTDLREVIGALDPNLALAKTQSEVRTSVSNRAKECLRRDKMHMYHVQLSPTIELRHYSNSDPSEEIVEEWIIARVTFDSPDCSVLHTAIDQARYEFQRPTARMITARLFIQWLMNLRPNAPSEVLMVNSILSVMLHPPTPAEALTGEPFRGPNYQYSSGSTGVAPSSSEPRHTRDIRLDHAPATQLVKNVIPEATGGLESWCYTIIQLCKGGLHHDLPMFLIRQSHPVLVFQAAVRERLKACKLQGLTSNDATRLDSTEARSVFDNIQLNFERKRLRYVPADEGLSVEQVEALVQMIVDILHQVRALMRDLPPQVVLHEELRNLLNHAIPTNVNGRDRILRLNNMLIGTRDVWGGATFDRLIQSKGDTLFDMIFRNLDVAEQDRVIELADRWVRDVLLRDNDDHSDLLNTLRGVSTTHNNHMQRLSYVDSLDDLRNIIEYGHFWSLWTLVGSHVKKRARISMAEGVDSAVYVVNGSFAGEREDAVLREFDVEPNTPKAELLLAVSALPGSKRTPANDEALPPDGRAKSVQLGPGAAPSAYGASLTNEMRGTLSSIEKSVGSNDERMANLATRLESAITEVSNRTTAMQKQMEHYVDGLRRDQAANNLGVQEQIRTVGRHLPTNHASQGLTPSVGMQMPVTRAGAATSHDNAVGSPAAPDLPSATNLPPTNAPFGRSPNFRNDPNAGVPGGSAQYGNRRFAPRPNQGRGPGFSLQFQRFTPTKYDDIDVERREEFKRQCDIHNETDYEEKGRRAPCAWCGGQHWLVHCPGGTWACTQPCRDKVGVASATATKLKYDAVAAANRQRQLVVASVGADANMMAMIDELASVPVSRLAAVVGDDIERICDMCNVTLDTDVDVMLAQMAVVMEPSYVNLASAEARTF